MVCGPILYQNINKEIIIIGYSHNSQGFPVEIENPKKLIPPYSTKELGEAILQSIKECEDTPLIEKPMDDTIIFKASGCKSLRAMGKLWQSLYFTKFPGGDLNLPSKSSEKGFRIHGAHFEKVNYIGTIHDPRCTIPLESTPEEIGENVLRIFDEILEQNAIRAAKAAAKLAAKEKRLLQKTIEKKSSI